MRLSSVLLVEPFQSLRQDTPNFDDVFSGLEIGIFISHHKFSESVRSRFLLAFPDGLVSVDFSKCWGITLISTKRIIVDIVKLRVSLCKQTEVGVFGVVVLALGLPLVPQLFRNLLFVKVV